MPIVAADALTDFVRETFVAYGVREGTAETVAEGKLKTARIANPILAVFVDPEGLARWRSWRSPAQPCRVLTRCFYRPRRRRGSLSSGPATEFRSRARLGRAWWRSATRAVSPRRRGGCVAARKERLNV